MNTRNFVEVFQKFLNFKFFKRFLFYYFKFFLQNFLKNKKMFFLKKTT